MLKKKKIQQSKKICRHEKSEKKCNHKKTHTCNYNQLNLFFPNHHDRNYANQSNRFRIWRAMPNTVYIIDFLQQYFYMKNFKTHTNEHEICNSLCQKKFLQNEI